jgi:hypothetical protein
MMPPQKHLLQSHSLNYLLIKFHRFFDFTTLATFLLIRHQISPVSPTKDTYIRPTSHVFSILSNSSLHLHYLKLIFCFAWYFFWARLLIV